MKIADSIRAHVLCHTAVPDRMGPLALGTTKLKVHAKNEGFRTIVVQLWYPIDTATGSELGPNWLWKLRHPKWARARPHAPLTRVPNKLPLIIYVPDARGRHDDNTFTLANLASHGFVLAAIDKPFLNRHGRSGGASKAQRRTPQVGDAVKKASMLLDALQGLKPGQQEWTWANRLELRRVGILGFALGGAVAAESTLVDRRYGAAANLSGPMLREARLVPLPYLLMLSDFEMAEAGGKGTKAVTGNEPLTRLEEYHLLQHQAEFPQSHIIELAGAKREYFSDRLIFASSLFSRRPELPNYKRIRTIIDSYLVAFFSTYLQLKPHPLMFVRHSPYAEVRFVDGSKRTQQEPAGGD